MKRYVKAAFADDRINTPDIDMLKNIISEALAPYGIEPVSCHITQYGVTDIHVMYEGQEYKVYYEGDIHWSDNIASIDDYESSIQFQIVLASVFFPIVYNDKKLIQTIQSELTDIFNSISAEDGTYVECDFIGGNVYADPRFSKRPHVSFFPESWKYYSPEGLISENSGYHVLYRGNTVIAFDVFEVYDILTSGIDSFDLESKVESYFKSLGEYYYNEKPKVEQSIRRKAVAQENFNRLKDYLETKLHEYHVQVESDDFGFITVHYNIDGWRNSYNPQGIRTWGLWNMDDAMMKKIYTLTRKAINKAKHGSEYESYQKRNRLDDESSEW